VLDVATSNIPGCLWRETYAYQLSWISLFLEKRAQLHLERTKFPEVFLSKTKSIPIGKKCATCSCF
jgi:hypothetical protein